jgi:hypothetical protein
LVELFDVLNPVLLLEDVPIFHIQLLAGAKRNLLVEIFDTIVIAIPTQSSLCLSFYIPLSRLS